MPVRNGAIIFVTSPKCSPRQKEPKGGIEDIVLIRYTCYLIALNGDAYKHTIAFAQTYFTAKIRKQEIIAQRYWISQG